MKISNPFRHFSRREFVFWLISLALVLGSFFLFSDNYLTLTASLIGVTALAFVSKGLVFGQFVCVIFAVFYAMVSFYLGYYGEMITYLGMSAPISALSIVSWLRHRFADSPEVEVHRMTKRELSLMLVLAALVTFAFFFILRALGNASLPVSTLSVTTSFLAAYMLLMRCPYYALGYAANDVVLIVLWVIACFEESISNLPMVVCFVIFLLYDTYGFYNWKRMQKRQERMKQAR